MKPTKQNLFDSLNDVHDEMRVQNTEWLNAVEMVIE